MNRVRRAIIMAAGYGNRMLPITRNIPKPLIKVNGTAMIETIIRALLANNIEEIYIVVGYLKEQFKSLAEKYPMISLIENPYFDSCNNISSLYAAREYLEEAMILDGDQVIYNEKILSPYFQHSGYNCVWAEDDTEEWLLTTEANRIISCSRTGGRQGWQLYSISRWTKDDGMRWRKHLEQEFDIHKNRQIYWDDIPIFCYPEKYELEVYPMKSQDVREIDSVEELATIDESYRKYIM